MAKKVYDRKQNSEYKKSIKKLWIALLFCFPVLILCNYLLARVGVNSYVAIFISVAVGGFILLFVYMVYDKIAEKRKLRDLTEEKEKDPFLD